MKYKKSLCLFLSCVMASLSLVGCAEKLEPYEKFALAAQKQLEQQGMDTKFNVSLKSDAEEILKIKGNIKINDVANEVAYEADTIIDGIKVIPSKLYVRDGRIYRQIPMTEKYTELERDRDSSGLARARFFNSKLRENMENFYTKDYITESKQASDDITTLTLSLAGEDAQKVLEGCLTGYVDEREDGVVPSKALEKIYSQFEIVSLTKEIKIDSEDNVKSLTTEILISYLDEDEPKEISIKTTMNFNSFGEPVEIDFSELKSDNIIKDKKFANTVAENIIGFIIDKIID